MLNTVKWVGISLFVQFTVGFAMALLLKKKFKGSGLYQGLIFFPWAVSGFIIGIMWRWMFNGTSGVINDLLMRIHLIGQPVGWLASKNTALYSCIIANIWYGIPFFTIMITAALRGVSEDLYEAADVDGATGWQKFIRITVPMLSNTTFVVAILLVIEAFNMFESIFVMTQGGPLGSTSTIMYYIYEQGFTNYNMGYASALAWIFFAIIMVVTLIQYRFRHEQGGE